jgi:hypothetical protein
MTFLSDSPHLWNEESLLFLIVDLAKHFHELRRHIRAEFLNSDCDFFNIFQIVIWALIWKNIIVHLVDSIDEYIQATRFHRLTQSQAVSDICLPYLVFVFFEAKRFALFYQCLRDGFKITEFHKRSEGHMHTLPIILSPKDHIFGVFTPHACSLMGSYQRDDDMRSATNGCIHIRNWNFVESFHD